MEQRLVWMLDDEWEDHHYEEKYFSGMGYRFIVSTSRSVEEDFHREGRQAHALIQQVGFRFPARWFQAMPNLKIVCVPGVGYDHVDVDLATQRGVWVSNIPDYCIDEVADHTVAMLLYFHRNLRVMDEDVRSGIWNPLRYVDNRRTAQSTVGLVGFGRIGRRVAAKLTGIGFKVVAFDPKVDDQIFRDRQIPRLPLESLIQESDYISVHLPSAPETDGLLNSRLLEQIQPHAVLINTARGSIIDESALLRLLESGRIRAAALDVFQVEPLPLDHPFRKLRNILLSPHAAYVTRESIDELKNKLCREVSLVLEGLDPVYALNRPAGSR